MGLQTLENQVILEGLQAYQHLELMHQLEGGELRVQICDRLNSKYIFGVLCQQQQYRARHNVVQNLLILAVAHQLVFIPSKHHCM